MNTNILSTSSTLRVMRWELGRVRGEIKASVLSGDRAFVVRFGDFVYLRSGSATGFTTCPAMADSFPDAQSAALAGRIRSGHGDMWDTFTVEKRVAALTDRAVAVAGCLEVMQ